MIDKQRMNELLDFMRFEKDYFMDLHADMDEEEFDISVENFNDTIQVIQSVLNEM